MTLEGIHAIYITVPSPSERLVGTGEFVIPALLVPEQADHGFKPDGALAFRFTATAFSLLVGWLIRNGAPRSTPTSAPPLRPHVHLAGPCIGIERQALREGRYRARAPAPVDFLYNPTERHSGSGV